MKLSKEKEFHIKDHKNFKTVMSFNVITMEDSFDHDVAISCAEDLSEVMNLFFKKDWKTLFHDWNNGKGNWYKDVCDVELAGLYVVMKEDGKGHVYYRMHRTQEVTVNVDTETLGDENAKKIEDIRKIIGR